MLFSDTLLDTFYQNVESIGDGEPSASRVSPPSPVTIQGGVPQEFVADGADSGGDLDHAEWTLTGPESDNQVDPILFLTSSERRSYTRTFSLLGDYSLSCRFFDDDGDSAEAVWQVQVVEAPRGNLIIAHMDVPGQSVISGQRVSAEVTIHNAGDARSTAGVIALYARSGAPSFRSPRQTRWTRGGTRSSNRGSLTQP